jgi:hypothetical protein
MIREAVYGADALRREIAEQESVTNAKRIELEAAQTELGKRRLAHAAAERRLADLIASGACTTENGCSHGHAVSASDIATIVNATGNPANDTTETFAVLDQQDMPIRWRIALMLLANPVLDYQGTAERLYGPGLDYLTAKNRVNGHVTSLRKAGVLTRLGANTFRIDPAMLAELSGLPVEGAAMTT